MNTAGVTNMAEVPNETDLDMCMLKLGLVEPLQQPDNICTGHEQISSERTTCAPIPSPPIQHKTVHTQGILSNYF